WLVVLSACQTGIGKIGGGEGVMGLQRGFFQAGAQNLLMTLWPVADSATAKFMEDFYAAVHRSGNPSEALASVQRDWLVGLRQRQNLATAVSLGGPFTVRSQGALQ
ncbi:MAG TPA: CHAT domain-containing protein, partial [Candidatus Sulfotelmatobacter sp.]|nr:CHAT domain-containing protein [Candidatus Sulfotelmatobacter sp.]